MIEKLLYPYHRARMSELGKELLEAAQHDNWKLSEYRWTHIRCPCAQRLANRTGTFIHNLGEQS